MSSKVGLTNVGELSPQHVNKCAVTPALICMLQHECRFACMSAQDRGMHIFVFEVAILCRTRFSQTLLGSDEFRHPSLQFYVLERKSH